MIHTDVAIWTILIAFCLDWLAGDPPQWPHPIRWMGKAIEVSESVMRPLPISLTISGGLMAMFLIAATAVVTWLLLLAATKIHPLAGRCLEIVLIYYCLSARSLHDAGTGVWRAIHTKGLEAAKSRLQWIVGRDVRPLDRTGVAAATVETVAENVVDGVIAPLFFAAIGGAPMAMAYKMTNTLDSMIGYRDERYRQFGSTAARIDDAANYVPARLALPLIFLAAQILNGRGHAAWWTARRDGRQHLSPNAGLAESAFSGALKVRLGGPNIYHGQRVEKPYIGGRFQLAQPADIPQACDLMALTSVLAAMGCWLVSIIRLAWWGA